MTENEGGERREATSPPPIYRSLAHYLIVRREPTGFEAPHTFFRCGERVLPVFCAREAARRFIDTRDLGEGAQFRSDWVPGDPSLTFGLRVPGDSADMPVQ